MPHPTTPHAPLTPAPPPPGRRARKLAAGRRRVENVAVDQCLRHGYANVTVAQICAQADVSTSTFFNYFGSKERAVLGAPPYPSERAVEAFVGSRGTGLLHDLAHLMLTGAREAMGDLDLFRRRLYLVTGTPELEAGEAARRARSEAAVVRATLERLRSDQRCGTPATQAHARMAVTLAEGVMRQAFATLHENPDADWDATVASALRVASDVVRDAAPS